MHQLASNDYLDTLVIVFKRTFLLAEQFGSVFGQTSIFYELFYDHFQKGAKVDITGFFKTSELFCSAEQQKRMFV